MPTTVLAETQVNPIDMIEGIATGRDWIIDRPSAEEMAVEAPGRWCDYGLYFSWSEALRVLHFSCAFDLRVPAHARSSVHSLLALANERLWMGHFALWQDEGLPLFRQTVQSNSGGMDVTVLDDLMEVAVTECDRFYPAFQFVIWGGSTAEDAVAAAMLDVAGEA